MSSCRRIFRHFSFQYKGKEIVSQGRVVSGNREILVLICRKETGKRKFQKKNLSDVPEDGILSEQNICFDKRTGVTV